MLNRLFPPSLTNDYRGSWIALWLFLPVLVVKTLMGVNFSGLNPFVDVRDILMGVDAVPLDTFSPEAAQSVVSSAAAWGMALVALCLFAWIVVVRYRGGLPLAIAIFLVEQLGRTGAACVHAIAALAAEGKPLAVSALINTTLGALLILALGLSLLRVRGPQAG